MVPKRSGTKFSVPELSFFETSSGTISFDACRILLNIFVADSFPPIVIDRKLFDLKVTVFYKIAVFLDGTKSTQFEGFESG